VLIAFVAVVVFMCIYYLRAGAIASTALFANLLLTIGFMVAVKATFTLPGLAGLVLMMGMAVDANVLIYERFREERERGAGLPLAIRNGYDRALPTIIDTHLTSIFTAIVLYAVGNDQLKGFAVSLTAGLLISLFTSLYMTRTIFNMLLYRNWIKDLWMFKILSRPNVDFMAWRYVFFSATVAFSIFGLLVFALRGEKGLNIDFTGGTAYSVEFKQPQEIGFVRQTVDERQFVADRVEFTDLKKADDVQAALEKTLPNVFVEPVYGAGSVASGQKEANAFVIYTTETDAAKVTQAVAAAFGASVASSKTELQKLPDPSVDALYPKGGWIADPGSQQGPYPGFRQAANATEQAIATLTPDFTFRTTLKNREVVQWMVSHAFGDGLVWAEVQAGKVKDVPNQRLDKQFDLTFTNKPGSAEEVGRLVAGWLASKGVQRPEQYFDVTTVAAGGPANANDLEKKSDTIQVNLAVPEGANAQELVSYLVTKGGPLYQPKSERLENFDSQLATEMQGKALAAIALSWLAITGYLWFRFGNWTFGLAAVLCLIHDLMFTIGLIGLCHYLVVYTPIGGWLLLEDFKLDLPAVAALLTLVGYSVSDTIVVFDRIREVRGKSPDLTPQMINDSVNQTLSRTLLTSLTTFLVVVVLYIGGGSGVHLFSFVMCVGVIVGTYSSIFVASPLLLWLGEGKRKEPVRGGRTVPQEAAT
jgi:SecD/SecF fusion protein